MDTVVLIQLFQCLWQSVLFGIGTGFAEYHLHWNQQFRRGAPVSSDYLDCRQTGNTMCTCTTLPSPSALIYH